MSNKEITKQLMNIFLYLSTDESYTKKEAAADLLQVIKNVEKNGVEVNGSNS